MREPKRPKIFTKEQMVRLVDAIDEPRVMIAVLLGFFCGLRIGEACRVRRHDIDWKNKVLTIPINKSGRPQYIEIPDEFCAVLKRYCESIESDWLVYSKKDNESVCSKTFREYFDYYMHKAGLLVIIGKMKNGKQRKLYTFHILRHTFCSVIRSGTGDDLIVRDAARHSSVQISNVYSHALTDMRTSLNKAFFKRGETKEMVPEPVPTQTPQEQAMAAVKMEFAAGRINAHELKERIEVLRSIE